MQTLRDRKIVIAGATGDIGSRTAGLLSGSGAELYLLGRSRSSLQEIGEHFGVPEDRLFTADITSYDDVFAAASAIPVPDILINAAGVGLIRNMEQLEPADMVHTLNVNLLGAFHLVKAFLPKMKESGKGLIINIPGVLGKVPMAGAAAYAASKYGLVGMMQSIREELKRTEIRITNIYLGGVDSAFWDEIDLRVQRNKMINADDAAKAIWFLCQQPESGVVSEMVLQPFNHQAI